MPTGFPAGFFGDVAKLAGVVADVWLDRVARHFVAVQKTHGLKVVMGFDDVGAALPLVAVRQSNNPRQSLEAVRAGGGVACIIGM